MGSVPCGRARRAAAGVARASTRRAKRYRRVREFARAAATMRAREASERAVSGLNCQTSSSGARPPPPPPFTMKTSLRQFLMPTVPPPPPMAPAATREGVFATVDATNAARMVPPPPPPAAAAAATARAGAPFAVKTSKKAKAVKSSIGAKKSSEVPPPKPPPPKAPRPPPGAPPTKTRSKSVDGDVRTVKRVKLPKPESSTDEDSDDEESEEGEIQGEVVERKKEEEERVPPPKPPPPKPPKPPPPKPPKPPLSRPPLEVRKARIRRLSGKGEDDESDEEEEGELPKLVNLLEPGDAFEENEGGQTPPAKFKKIDAHTTSHELMGGGEFDTIEKLSRIRDDADESTLNNVNSPQYKKRSERSRETKRALDDAAEEDRKFSPELSRLVESRKLALVLDLDHTLLNSVAVPELRMNANSLNNAVVLLDADVARAERAQDPLVRTVFHLEHLDLLTKLRPGVREFLQSASVLFDIHINTMGSQEYAEQMVALLDPETKWIKGTVKGLGEMEGGRLWAPSEKVLDGPLEKLVDACLIFDDTASVWASYRENLITCERYLFFAESRRQFGLSGLSLLEVGHDESKEEGMLSTALKVFQSVHTAFFERYDVLEKSSLPNVQSILHEHRMDVLAGVHVVFSRVFPIDMDPTKHPLWILAEDFGAKCATTITEETTHVVATARSTDKVRKATSRGDIKVVTPHWLECSMLMWRHANEDSFRLM